MTDNDKQEFAICLATLCEVFGREPMTKPAITAYWLVLRRLPLNNFKAAAEKALSTLKFMPKPAELLELAGLDDHSRMIQAWDILCEARGRAYDFQKTQFADRVLGSTVRNLGGLCHLADTPNKDFNAFVFQRFKEIYLATIARESSLPTITFAGGNRNWATPNDFCLFGEVDERQPKIESGSHDLGIDLESNS